MVEMNTAFLVDLSTMTRIALKELETGRGEIRSTEICEKGIELGSTG